MGKKIPRITNSEMQILEVLWDEGEALTSSEIVEVSDDRTWKSSSVHLLLNSLLKKNFVRVAGFKKTTKNYARTFEPSMTREEYSMKQLQQEKKKNTRVFSGLFNTFADFMFIYGNFIICIYIKRRENDEKGKMENNNRSGCCPYEFGYGMSSSKFAGRRSRSTL